MRSITLRGCAAAIAFVGLAAPAAAQRIDDGYARTTPTIVLGETPARTCYERAESGTATTSALEHCDRALAGGLAPSERAATYVNRAVLRELRGDLTGAAADLEEAIALQPELAQAHANLGGVLLRMERWADAEAALDRAIALAADEDAQARFMRAAAREEQGELEGAYTDYRRAAELAPEWEAPRLELERFQVVTDGTNGGA